MLSTFKMDYSVKSYSIEYNFQILDSNQGPEYEYITLTYSKLFDDIKLGRIKVTIKSEFSRSPEHKK